MRMLFLCFIVMALMGACSSLPTGNSTPIVMTAEMSTVVPDDGNATASTLQPPPTVPTALKYRILEEFPDFFYCDADFYPIAREDESVLAQQRFPELQTNQDEFQAILAQNRLSNITTFTDEQKLLIYREHKKLNAIYFETAGDKLRFQIQTGQEGQQGTIITGTIDASGSIDILQRENGFPSCPICLTLGSLIDTPRGAVSVEELQVGHPVWTMNEAGERVPGIILQVGSVRVPASHQVLHVTLSDGRELWVSPGHPTADGRIFAELKLGDTLDEALIVQVEQVTYTESFTFDILPSGTTGFYWSNGILVGSTLKNNSEILQTSR